MNYLGDAEFRSFCVIVPMFNEEAGAELCVKRICEVLSSIPYHCALVAVDDGSKDSTAAILDRQSQSLSNLTVIHHATNRGYGAALGTGVTHAIEAGFNYVLFMDSDLTNDPDDIPRFVVKMKAGYDVVKATRYSDGGTVQGVPFFRVAVSRVGNWIARILLGLPISDCTNGFRAIRSTLLDRMTLTEPKFPIIMEELYCSAFLTRRFAEVPVTLTNRREEQRPTSFVYRPRVFFNYLKYPLKKFLGVRPRGLLEGELVR